MTLTSIEAAEWEEQEARAETEYNRRKWEADRAKRKALEADAPAARRYVKQCSPADIANLLSDYANNYNVGRDAGKEMAQGLMRQHRTLQQSVIRFLVSALVVYGNEVGAYYDGRNEQSAKFCRRFAELVKDGTLDPYFPMI